MQRAPVSVAPPASRKRSPKGGETSTHLQLENRFLAPFLPPKARQTLLRPHQLAHLSAAANSTGPQRLRVGPSAAASSALARGGSCCRWACSRVGQSRASRASWASWADHLGRQTEGGPVEEPRALMQQECGQCTHYAVLSGRAKRTQKAAGVWPPQLPQNIAYTVCTTCSLYHTRHTRTPTTKSGGRQHNFHTICTAWG